MTVVAWILTVPLALLFAMAGWTKLITPRERLLAEERWGWAKGFSQLQIRTIAALEVAGAIGLVVPWLVDVAPVLTPLAAVGLAITMVGAIVVHGRRSEWASVRMNIVLLALATAVAVLRFAQL